MEFEVNIIKALQRLSNGFTDVVFLGISQLGTELAFLAVAVVLYWVIDKRYAYRFLNVYILGVAVTNFIKLGVMRQRPFDAFPRDVRSIGEPETTYSFPSGHTESISSISALLTLKYGKAHRSVPIVYTALVLLVMISRMFLGQHYFTDVLCGLILGIVCVILFNALLSLFGNREELFGVIGFVFTIILICVLGISDGLNSPSGMDLLKGVGAFIAFDICYAIEKYFVRYDVKANRKWWKVLLRLVLGLGVAVGIQQGFKFFLPESISMLYCFFRYFVMATWVALAAPTLFKALKI